MDQAYVLTRHARERSTARAIPPMIAEMIVEFGHPHDSGKGTLKYFLTKESMHELRRLGGREIAKAIEPYRNRNAYVVVAAGHIITVSYASRSVCH